MIEKLFEQNLQVVNVGLSAFSDSIVKEGGSVFNLDWQPPAKGDHNAGMDLAKLINHNKVENANHIAFDKFLSTQPVLADVVIAGSVIPGFEKYMVLHAGPPVLWENMCGPMKGAVIGAILFEGWAKDSSEAQQLAESGRIRFSPCHQFGAVGPMAGVISPSMPVWVIKNLENSHLSFSGLNEGLGKVLRFGAYDSSVLDRLNWMVNILAPILHKTLRVTGEIELRPLIAQALHMGDECHNRNAAASSLLFKKLAPAMISIDENVKDISDSLKFIAGNDHFFLNISMAACKSMLDAAHNIPYSSLVTAMARNGVEFGIRLSGTGDEWFTAPAPMVEGLFFPGFSMDDSAPDLGDSSITETCGIGGFAMGGAPAIVQFVGGTPQDAVAFTRQMFQITMGINSGYTSPALNFNGLPAGIDARKVVDTGIEPIINTGIAHKDPGVGQVGAGITRAPMDCFIKGVSALSKTIDE